MLGGIFFANDARRRAIKADEERETSVFEDIDRKKRLATEKAYHPSMNATTKPMQHQITPLQKLQQEQDKERINRLSDEKFRKSKKEFAAKTDSALGNAGKASGVVFGGFAVFSGNPTPSKSFRKGLHSSKRTFKL